jgi:hypothetical protein
MISKAGRALLAWCEPLLPKRLTILDTAAPEPLE